MRRLSFLTTQKMKWALVKTVSHTKDRQFENLTAILDILKEVSTLCMMWCRLWHLAGSGKICGDQCVFRVIVRSINEILKKTEKTLKRYPHCVTTTFQQQFARQAFCFVLRPLAGTGCSRKKTRLNEHPCDCSLSYWVIYFRPVNKLSWEAPSTISDRDQGEGGALRLLTHPPHKGIHRSATVTKFYTRRLLAPAPYSGFQVTGGWSNGAKSQDPKKSLGLLAKPPKKPWTKN